MNMKKAMQLLGLRHEKAKQLGLQNDAAVEWEDYIQQLSRKIT